MPTDDLQQQIFDDLSAILDDSGIPLLGISNLGLEGFPHYMIYAFLQTAKNTKTVVSSRVPGGVGTDLIDNGHDLKGYHIKAKSCNWGPMAGFICQLPYLNKKGTSKINANAEKTAYYLSRIESFSLDKGTIVIWEDLIAKSDTDEERKENEAELRKALKEISETEKTSGDWSGENKLVEDSPFVQLKRKFSTNQDEALASVKEMKGVLDAVKVGSDKIYGVATDWAKEEPTVAAEFLMVQEDTSDLWKLYHGGIKCRNKEDSADETAVSGTTSSWVKASVTSAYASTCTKTFTFSDVTDAPTGINNGEFSSASTNNFATPATTFYAMNGIMNPFPPFDKESSANVSNPDYYKNAVSGDYDLFAMWPHMDVSHDELIRESEYIIGKRMRLGGKIFNLFIGSEGNFGVEFIPGYTELGNNGWSTKIAESADFGNINSLGHLVAGTLNNLAMSFFTKLSSMDATGNQCFHSDEGGRPGIMEIEFPVAIFFPEKITTKALNNFEYVNQIKATKDRDDVQSTGGLIYNIEELVTLIQETQIANYRVMMHSDWIMHILYCTLTNSEKTTFNSKYESDAGKADKLEEFEDIKVHMNNWEPTADYISKVKEIVKVDDQVAGDATYFTELRDAMLELAFEPDKLSYEKRTAIETIVTESRT